jgi:septal ring-binding cell division protein DamX
MTPKNRTWCLPILVIAVVAAAAPAVALAADGENLETKTEASATEGPAKPAMLSGQVIPLDPATGRRIAPTAEQRAAVDTRTRAMMNRSSAGLFETASPRSGVMVNLLGGFRSAAVMTLNNGEVEAQCTTSVEEVPVMTEASSIEGGGDR